MKFVDWESRPALWSVGKAWAVLAPGEPWTEVDPIEVGESGKLLPNEASLAETFSTTFGTLPPLPTASDQEVSSPSKMGR